LVVIDPAGTVGSIIDLRDPNRPPAGEHWVSEPQRSPVTAREVGQVFGVALDADPNIYLAATSSFGLHRTPDNSRWLEGMWGASGGPGTIYRLDRDTGYRPRVFADVNLNGRPNAGAGLGNIAVDKWNQQVFASDLETGMIHRFRMADGGDLGFYDHGTQGRTNFLDGVSGQRGNLPPIPFDPASRPRIDDCPTGKFDNSPECWNFATSGRRVWGIAVWRHPTTGETRLYYSVWSGPAFGDPTWSASGDDSEKRNSIWSVQLGPDGGFAADIRREFLLPDFFTDPATVAIKGFSSPVSDITFPECGGTGLMLLGERGGIRNLGLEVNNPFAAPHESRALQAGLNARGSWRLIGRYDVGFYNRRLDGEPFVRANCAGGVAFGPGYANGRANPAQPDQFAWISGDALCSVDGPCNSPGRIQPGPGAQPQTVSDQSVEPDDSEVHGLQGNAVGLFSQIVPPRNANDQAAGVDQAYLVDLDINVDGAGNVIPDTLVRDDATRIGDVAIYQICGEPTAGGAPPPLAFVLPVMEVAHWPVFSHSRAGTHNPRYSHHRHGTHNPKLSHERERSHTRSMTHHRHISGPTHSREQSVHRPPQTHNPRISTDLPVRSHYRRLSHVPPHSHNTQLTHRTKGSDDHNPRLTHRTKGSDDHNPRLTHRTKGSDDHNPRLTHRTKGSDDHNPALTHRTKGSDGHNRKLTHRTVPSHNPKNSGHKPSQTHNQTASHRPVGSHNPRISRGGDTHSRRISAGGDGHNRRISRGGEGHNRRLSAGGGGGHNRNISRDGEGGPRRGGPGGFGIGGGGGGGFGGGGGGRGR
jgi:hypothetical protein